MLANFLNSDTIVSPPPAVLPLPTVDRTVLARRVIACLDVRSNDAGDLVVTKGDQYDVREKDDDRGVVAQVASYELVSNRDQRFLVGLFSDDEGMGSHGTAELTFSFLGAEGAMLDAPTPARAIPRLPRSASRTRRTAVS